MELVKLECIWHSGTNKWKDETSLHRCREGIPVNNGTRIEGVSLLVRIGSRGQDTKCVAVSRTTKRLCGNTSQTMKTLVLLQLNSTSNHGRR